MLTVLLIKITVDLWGKSNGFQLFIASLERRMRARVMGRVVNIVVNRIMIFVGVLLMKRVLLRVLTHKYGSDLGLLFNITAILFFLNIDLQIIGNIGSLIDLLFDFFP